jgi:UDP-N-acetylglucosamine acyltransferase
VQGGSAISKDLPPYTVARGDNTICGLNTVGLRRAGFTNEQRLELKRLYHVLFRGDRRLNAVLTEARRAFSSEQARLLIDFVSSAKRGVCRDTSSRVRETEAA